MSQNTPQKSANSPDPPPMSPTHHRLLSTFLFEKTPEKENERLDCAICLCSLSRIDTDITETRCKHYFHSSCLDEMKSKMKSKCPICRHPITPPSNPPRDFNNPNSPHHLDNFYSQQNSLNSSHNPHHTTTQASIVTAARRGREAVQLAIARRERDQLNRRGDTAIQSG